MDITELLLRGGPVMYVLLFCSTFALAIVLERLTFWTAELQRIPYGKIGDFIVALKTGEDAEIIRSTRGFSDDHLLSRLQSAAAHTDDKSAIINCFKIESERAYARSLRHLSGLDTVVSVAPLLGILGTVLGIMKSFHALDLQNLNSTGVIGNGLAEAMITTATGLIIAVPTLVVYNFLISMATRHAARLYRCAEDLAYSTENTS